MVNTGYSYPALTMNKYDGNATTFPKLRICSHSQHSAKKLKKYYPSLQGDIMQKFYGFASSRKEKELWNKYDSFKGMTHHV